MHRPAYRQFPNLSPPHPPRSSQSWPTACATVVCLEHFGVCIRQEYLVLLAEAGLHDKV